MILGKRFIAKSVMGLKKDTLVYLLEDVSEIKRLLALDTKNIKVKLADIFPTSLVISKENIKYYEQVEK